MAGQHKASLEKILQSALAHHDAGTRLAETVSSVDTGDFSDQILLAATPTFPYIKNPTTGITYTATETEDRSEVITKGYYTDYVFPLFSQFTMKDAVRLVASSNVSLAPGLIGSLTIDGVTVGAFDRILLAGQTNPAENGMYMFAVYDTSRVDLASIPPGVYVLARSYDGYLGEQYKFGNAVAVQQGTDHHHSVWLGTAVGVIPQSSPVLGTTAIEYRKVAGHTTQEDSFVATSNQTVFTLSKSPSTTASNTPKALYVYKNRQLVYRTEYTINTTTKDVTLATPATLSDIIYISYEV